MTFRNFYRYVYKYGDLYWIIKDGERYLSLPSLEEALFERDRLIAVDWDWELYCELPSTVNNYVHITLPPFHHNPKYISIDRERWTVVSKGRNGRYYGSYPSKDEAKKIALMYDGRIMYCPQRYVVQRRINGKKKSFGRYETLEEAEQRVLELMENDWEN